MADERPPERRVATQAIQAPHEEAGSDPAEVAIVGPGSSTRPRSGAVPAAVTVVPAAITEP